MKLLAILILTLLVSWHSQDVTAQDLNTEMSKVYSAISGLSGNLNSISSSQSDYLPVILKRTKGRIFRFEKMPILVFVDSDQLENREACKAACDLWQDSTCGLIKFSIVDDASLARIQIKFGDSSKKQIPAHTIMHWHYCKKTRKFIVPPQLIEVDLRALLRRGAAVRQILLRNIIAHEVGHALGLLGHSTDSADLMYGQTDENSKLSKRDLKTLHQLYLLPQTKVLVPL